MNIQKLLDDLVYADTIAMLKELAENFNAETKLLEVEKGSLFHNFEVYNPRKMSMYPTNDLDPVSFKKVRIDIIPFFGMHVGYNKELNTLVFWRN